MNNWASVSRLTSGCDLAHNAQSLQLGSKESRDLALELTSVVSISLSVPGSLDLATLFLITYQPCSQYLTRVCSNCLHFRYNSWVYADLVQWDSTLNWHIFENPSTYIVEVACGWCFYLLNNYSWLDLFCPIPLP